jgi:tyrosine-protein phosphatase SIW14
MFQRATGVFPVLIITVSIIAGPIAYARVRERQVRNFRVIEEGVLYRSAQPSPGGLDRLIHDHQIRTVISFRHPPRTGADPPDKWMEEYCAQRGIKHIRIVPRSWAPEGKGHVPAEEAIREFLEVVRNPRNHPVLMHCYRGVHRTGAYCAVFRMDVQGWSNEEALNELTAQGYDHLDKEEDVRGFLQGYKPHKAASK